MAALLAAAGLLAVAMRVTLMTRGSPVPPLSLVTDSRYMRWTSHRTDRASNITEWHGVLKVPLSHRLPATSPMLALEVTLLAAPGQTGASRGVLVGHCGGPGSGAMCGARVAYERAQRAGKNTFYAVGLSQRGVQLEAPELADPEVASMPRTFCTPDTLRPLPDPRPEKWGSYRVSDFTRCECALPDGAPSMGETWVDVDPANESQVRHYFRGIQERNRRCYESAKWLMVGTDGAVYNYLDYLGSNVLAFDLDRLRRGLRLPKISIAGFSYGTCVGAAFATILPRTIDRLELNSNCPPDAEAEALATGAARGLEQGIDKLLQLCSELRDGYEHGASRYHTLASDAVPCPLGPDPWASFDALLDNLRSSPGLTARAAPDSPPFRLGVGMVGGYVSTCMNLQSWMSCLGHLAGLASPNATVRDAKIKQILDERCTLPDPSAPHDPSKRVITWRLYGVCLGASHVGMNVGEQDSFLDQSSIMGVDYYGRFSLHAAMRVYRRARDDYGTPATGAFLGWFGALFDWPANPDPIRSGGTTRTKALVSGNLYDPGTAFGWTAAMRKAFPDSALLVSQGVGHITDGRRRWVDFLGRVDGRWVDDVTEDYAGCLEAVTRYWASGELPVDGLVCREGAPVVAAEADGDGVSRRL